jgi:hypothetical protein
MLTAAERATAFSSRGILAAQLTPAQQDALLRPLLSRGYSPQIINGLRVRFDYVPAGAYRWVPEDAPGGAIEDMRRRAVVWAVTPEEALAAARRLEPRAVPEQIRRTDGGLFSVCLFQGDVVFRHLLNDGD